MKKLLIFSMVVFVACSQGGLEPRQYIQWFAAKDNPLSKKMETNDYVFTVSLLPPDYFRARDYLAGSDKEQTDSSLYIKLVIKPKKSPAGADKNPELGSETLAHLISGIENDAALFCGKDTLLTQMHHYERTYHAGNSLVIMFVYDQAFLTDKGFTFMYRDQLYNQGDLQFAFSKEDLEKTPNLNL